MGAQWRHLRAPETHKQSGKCSRTACCLQPRAPHAGSCKTVQCVEQVWGARGFAGIRAPNRLRTAGRAAGRAAPLARPGIRWERPGRNTGSRVEVHRQMRSLPARSVQAQRVWRANDVAGSGALRNVALVLPFRGFRRGFRVSKRRRRARPIDARCEARAGHSSARPSASCCSSGSCAWPPGGSCGQPRWGLCRDRDGARLPGVECASERVVVGHGGWREVRWPPGVRPGARRNGFAPSCPFPPSSPSRSACCRRPAVSHRPHARHWRPRPAALRRATNQPPPQPHAAAPQQPLPVSRTHLCTWCGPSRPRRRW